MPIADPAQRRAYHQARCITNVNAGRCRCGRDRAPNRSKCETCAAVASRQAAERNAQRKQRGLCRHCGKPPETGKSKCESCRLVGIEYLRRLKDRVISAYGGRCGCCGEENPAFLTIDHINDDGTAHRKEIGSNRVYQWLEKRGFPKDAFRLLCFNCNCGRRVNGGICPHQAAKQPTP